MDRFKEIQKNLAATTGKYLSAIQSIKPNLPTFQEHEAFIKVVETMDQFTKNIKDQLTETTNILRESLKEIDWDNLIEFNSYVDLIDEYQKKGWAMPQLIRLEI